MNHKSAATYFLITLSVLAFVLVLPTGALASAPQVAVGGQQAQAQDMSGTPEAQILREVLQTSVAHEDFARKARVDFFPAPDGNTFMMLVLRKDSGEIYKMAVSPSRILSSTSPRSGGV